MDILFGFLGALVVMAAFMPVCLLAAWGMIELGEWTFDLIATAQEWQAKKGWM